jgi:hexosaminidase
MQVVTWMLLEETSEGYSIHVTIYGIVITGASPLGAFWGTRSILQQATLSGGMKLSLGSAIDSPGWAIRGAFVRTFQWQGSGC